MNPGEIKKILEKQQVFFNTNVTKDIEFRKKALKKLRTGLIKYEKEINKAFRDDLHKSEFETWGSETGFVLKEIREHLRKLKSWSKNRKVKSPLFLFRATSMIQPKPHGIVLIMSPWNFPLQLLFTPLVGAIAAGNCIVLRPSSGVPHISLIMGKIIQENFPPEYIAYINGSRESAKWLLEQKFDFIFFTGSVEVGEKVAIAAANNLTPVALELGGKNPCIVAADANLKLAARRIAFGKFLNAGQTCVAPDYVLVHESVKEKLLENLKIQIIRFYGTNPAESNDFTHIVNIANIERLDELIKNKTVITGGDSNPEQRYFAPTIVDNVRPEDPLMQEEIFGPVLPVLTYTQPDEPIAFVNERPVPLVLYLFTRDRKWEGKVLQETCSGSAAINDTVLQYTNTSLPFGGKGESGMGKYHGKANFDTFTHYRSIMIKKNKTDFALRYPPYEKWKLKIIKWLIR